MNEVIISLLAFFVLYVFIKLFSPPTGANSHNSKKKKGSYTQRESSQTAINNPKEIVINSAKVEKNDKNLYATTINKNTAIRIFPELSKYKINELYHMTHISNLENIFKFGLLSNSQAHQINALINDISDPTVQLRREKLDSIYNKSLHTYVPLYFNPRNPMLFIRKNIQNKIALLVFDPNIIFNHSNVIFTDGNAASNKTKFFSSLSELNEVDWECIYNTEYWNNCVDGKRKKCAEVLVPIKIEHNEIKKVIVIDNIASRTIKSQLNKSIIRVEKDAKYFF